MTLAVAFFAVMAMQATGRTCASCALGEASLSEESASDCLGKGFHVSLGTGQETFVAEVVDQGLRPDPVPHRPVAMTLRHPPLKAGVVTEIAVEKVIAS